MDFGFDRVYEYELWSASGTRVADISHLVQDRQITLLHNDAEQFTFSMDLTEWEAFCAARKALPRTLLNPYQTELRIKRAGQYWKGGQVVATPITIETSASQLTVGSGSSAGALTLKISVIATGFLNLFKDRYVTATYTAVEAATIPANLINATQGQTNGSVGVTIPGGQYATGVLRDRTYVRQNVKEGIQNLTKLVNGRFDFEFTYDKQFKTYAQLGSYRTDVALQIGGPGGNVAGYDLELSGSTLYNRVIAVGSGTLTSTKDDVASQSSYYMRETIKQYNSVSVQSTLDDHAAADLASYKDLLAIPKVTITGEPLKRVPFLQVGDRVPLDSVYTTLSGLSGYYRIEKMVIALDDNDFESSIQLYFDDYTSNKDRLPRLSEDSLVEAIRRIRSDVDELKS